MKHLLPADGTEKKRSLPDLAENLRFEIGRADSGQAVRADLKFFETLPVHLERQVVIYTRSHVAPMSRRQHLVRGFLEIHQRERVLCTIQLDRGRLRPSSRLHHASQKRAASQEAQELAARAGTAWRNGAGHSASLYHRLKL